MHTVCRALSKASRRTPLHAVYSISLSYSTRTTRKNTKPKTPPPSPLPLPPEVGVIQTNVSAYPEDVEMIFDQLRPKEIPFQPKLVNAVNLIGTVQSNVQMYPNPSGDGNKLAATFIYQDRTSEFPYYLRIPIIFEGPLADTAACHLKEKDKIYVSGKLSTDPLPIALSNGEASAQVKVESLHFVGVSPEEKNHSIPKPGFNSGRDYMKKDLHLWDDLVSNPTQWNDYRNDKRNNKVKPKYPDFKHKKDGHALWISSGPKGILTKLEGLEFDAQAIQERKNGGGSYQGDQAKYGVGSYQGNQTKKPAGSKERDVESWTDLVENPNNWWDNRSKKMSARSPDFKHKETKSGLWLSSAPKWVLEKVPPAKSS